MRVLTVALALCCAGGPEQGYILTLEFVMAMIETFKKQEKIHRRFAFQIVLEVHLLFAPYFIAQAWAKPCADTSPPCSLTQCQCQEAFRAS